MNVYKIYRTMNVDEFWANYWIRVSEDNDFIVNYDYYPFTALRDYLSRDMKILEIGCGTGRVLKGLSNEKYNIMACDLDLNSLQSINAKKKYRVFRADLRNMPVKNSTFDAVLCFGVLTCIEDIHEIRRILNDISNILRDNGILIISLLNYNLLRKIQRFVFFIESLARRRYFYGWASSIIELEKLLKGHFEVIKRIPSISREPIWHNAPLFRGCKTIDEKIARVDDTRYQLNTLGEWLFKKINKINPFMISGSTTFICRK